MQLVIRQLILKVLLASDGPTTEDVLRAAVRRGLNAATTDGDLTVQIQWCEQQKLITGTADGLLGTVWDLTNAGRLKAQQLR